MLEHVVVIESMAAQEGSHMVQHAAQGVDSPVDSGSGAVGPGGAHGRHLAPGILAHIIDLHDRQIVLGIPAANGVDVIVDHRAHMAPALLHHVGHLQQ